ncbi:pilus assembly FimT family protein [Bythopirellula polymerisocia]|nr:GspH/FimT family pseudopilin [Bythopirellula polymerisocia]
MKTSRWSYLRTRCFAQPICRSAFSLVELTIVVLVVGIVTAIAAPKFDNALKLARVRSAAKWIKSDLSFAQRHASRTSSNQTVNFDTSTHSYALTGVSDINRRGQSYVIYLNDSKFNAQLVSADFGGSSSVTFNIHGQPDNAGTVVVRSGNTTKTIVMNSLGQVTIP